MQQEGLRQTAPAQANGKILVAGAAGGNWADSPQPVTANNGHSFAKAIEHVFAAHGENKFISYNNLPPDVPKTKTKSNSKGVLMMDITGNDAAAWIVHTVPGFPKARTGYLFPPAEVQKGHLLICLTIKEDQIDTIALTLRFATPLIYYNDIPNAQMDSRPNLKKLVSGELKILPPLTVTQDTTTAAPAALKVTIYSKGEKSRYEIYRKIFLQKLKSTIKVWTARDNKLKSDCRIFGKNIRLVTSPISVNGDQSTLENDVSQWLVTETGNIFCAVDKPYQKSQTMEPTMAVCIDDATISARFKEIAQNGFISPQHQNAKMQQEGLRQTAPAQANGKILVAGAAGGNWADSPQPVTANNGHSFAKAIEHVFAAHGENKFISYNNLPPDVPKTKTKSNSK
ncbi:Plancitoxin-1, partial [Trichinella pseudospiralis]